MKRRSKIIATLVTLSLAMAMVVVGVYSATIVSFGISGSISYVVDDVFVNITTKVYTSDIVAHNPKAFNASLVQEYKDMLALNAFASNELNNSVETLANTSISDIDANKYNLVKSYTYSSLTEEGDNPITDLNLNFNSTTNKTYFIVINIENLSSEPVYAVVQDEKNVPANTVELNSGLQQNIIKGEQNRNIVFALGVVDFSAPIDSSSKFECGIKVGLGDISQTPENLAKLNIAYTDEVGGYTASIKQDAKGVVVVPSTAPEQTRATNDIIAMMPVAQVSSMEEMANLVNTGVTHVYLPNTVSIIAPTAFTANAALTKIEGLENVVSIGEYAFMACVNLAKIDLPDNCSSIGAYAFNNCANLYSIDLPNSLTSLADYVLTSCSSLTSIDLKNIESIGNEALSCLDIYRITFPSTLKSCHWYSFFGTPIVQIINYSSLDLSSWKHVEITNNGNFSSVITIGEKYVTWEYEDEKCLLGFSNPGETHATDIPNDVTSVVGFTSCYYLQKIVFPNSVKKVYGGAFCWTPNLTYVDLGGVSYIGEDAMSGGLNLKTIIFPKENLITMNGFNFTIIDNVENIVIMNPNESFNDGSASSNNIYSASADFYIFAESGVSSNYSANENQVYYYSETQKSGNYWHFVNGVATKWN